MEQIVMKDVTQITPYANNPRRNDQAVEKVAQSIQEFGFKNPIIVDSEGVIICGHTRYEAALSLDIDTVPVIVADDLSPEQVKAFRIMDNKSSELADWDEQKLLTELLSLQDTNYDINLAGFEDIDLERLKMDFGGDLNSLDLEGEMSTNDDEEGQKAEKPYIIQYNIIFNNEAEQIRWHKFLVQLKGLYPELETISERIMAFINDNMEVE